MPGDFWFLSLHGESVIPFEKFFLLFWSNAGSIVFHTDPNGVSFQICMNHQFTIFRSCIFNGIAHEVAQNFLHFLSVKVTTSYVGIGLYFHLDTPFCCNEPKIICQGFYNVWQIIPRHFQSIFQPMVFLSCL